VANPEPVGDELIEVTGRPAVCGGCSQDRRPRVEATHSLNDTSKRGCTGAGQLPVTIQCTTDSGTGSSAVKARISACPTTAAGLPTERGR
jgi:hypothetical protein